jgi:hypothetical protein
VFLLRLLPLFRIGLINTSIRITFAAGSVDACARIRPIDMDNEETEP